MSTWNADRPGGHDGWAPDLSERECRELLAGSHIGRVSVSVGALPVVEPVRYMYAAGEILLEMVDSPAGRAVGRGKVTALGVDNVNLAEPHWAVLVIGRTTDVVDAEEPGRSERSARGPWVSARATRVVRLWPDIVAGSRAVPI